MADFLLELRCEEIPARMQAGARAELEKLFRRELDAAGVAVGDLAVWSTPRRLALIARGLPSATEAVSDEAKGPPVGAPDAAIDGFCRKNGVTRESLEERDVKGRATWFAVIEKPGQSVADLLAAAIPAIIRDFSWPKSMRWGAASISTDSIRWVRPLSGIVALLDGEVVPCVTDGLASGRETMGHRFHSAGAITIDGADDYAGKLRAAHVIVDHAERAAVIRAGAAKTAADAGLTLVEDEGLVIENAGLTEWPVPLLGRFDESYLDVPPEVIQLTARVNQKYFVCNSSPSGEGGRDPQGRGGEADRSSPLHHPSDGPPPRAGEDRLANAFVCTANIDATEPAMVVDGNRKVLAARLSDARFFWELDQKTPLADHAKKLARITFHEKLGSVADKVERVAKLARWLVESDVVTPRAPAEAGAHAASGLLRSQEITKERLADLAEAAARLCKADLVTEMVGEFPELQGLMGGYYAAKEGLAVEVSDAIRDHYKPVGQGDDVPTAPVTVAVSLADKLDTIIAFFMIEERPSGSKDPFALRRAALGAISIIVTRGLKASIKRVLYEASLPVFVQAIARDSKTMEARLQEVLDYTPVINGVGELADLLAEEGIAIRQDPPAWVWNASESLLFAVDFFADRLKVQQREAGVRHDLIDAVFALGGEDDLVRLLARVHALQAFVETENGTNLLAGYKRAANILKKENHLVTPANAGVHLSDGANGAMDSRVRGNDEGLDGLGEEDPLALTGQPEFDATMAAPDTALSYTPEKAEKALIDALDAAAPKAAHAVSEERFADAMAALATLRAPIDAFFEEVTVNDDDATKREARLNLLARFTRAVGNVADFSRIEG